MDIDKKTLRYRYLAPLYLSNVAEGICLTLTMFFIPLYVRQGFGEPSFLTISSIVAIPSGAMFVASNFWGALADYTKRLKPYLLIGLIGYGGCLLALSTSHNAVSVVLIATVSALFFAAVRPISQSYVTLLREQEKGRAVGNLMAYQSVGWFLGGITCGYLFEPVVGVSFESILVGISVFGAVVVIVVSFLLKPLPRDGLRESRKRSLFRGMTADLKPLYSSKPLLAVCILGMLASCGVWVFFGNFAVFLTEYAGASTSVLGWAMSLSTLLGIFSFGPSGRLVDRVGPMKVLSFSVIAYAVVYGLVSFTKDPILIAVYFCIPVYPAFQVSLITMVSELSGASKRAGGLGILAGVLAFALASGTLLGGAVADVAGLGVLPRWTLGFELVCLISIVVCIKVFRVLSIESGKTQGDRQAVPAREVS